MSNLNKKNHAQHHQKLFRPTPILKNCSNFSKSAYLSNEEITHNQSNSQIGLNWHQLTVASAASVDLERFNSTSYSNCFISFAGSEISSESKVYLLYEMSTALLARRFHDVSKIKDDSKILVSFFHKIISFYERYPY